MKLRDPEQCPKCGADGEVIESKMRVGGYRRRVHRCSNQNCRMRWWSFQTIIDPRSIRVEPRSASS